MDTFRITITNYNGVLKAQADVKEIGSQYDNEAQRLVFSRPQGYEQDDLILYFESPQGGLETEPVSIGTDNEYVLTREMTVSLWFGLQIAFAGNDGVIKHSNKMRFDLRPSIGGEPPLGPPLPQQVRDLNDKAYIQAAYEDGILTLSTATGKRTSLPIAGSDTAGPKGDSGPAGADALINGMNVLNIVDGKNTTVEINGTDLKINASGGGNGVYDRIIRTQAEFEELYNSQNWLGSSSIAFVGDGGTLEFTRQTLGLKIPVAVKRIDGFNGAKIRINDFRYNASSNQSGIWYETLPTTPDYSISNISLMINNTASGAVRGFFNCRNLSNCSVFAEILSLGSSSAIYGFLSCYYLMNCYSEVKGSENGSSPSSAFRECTGLVNCQCDSNSRGTGAGYGAQLCTNIVNCNSIGRSLSAAYGFRDCNSLSNCMGTGTGGLSAGGGYSFYNCTYLNGCKEGAELSTTAIWGGAWPFRDDQSCQLTR